MQGARVRVIWQRGRQPRTSWHVEGTGDFNDDGKSDIVLQNSNGSVAVWEMNGGQISQSGVVANPGPSWHVEGTGDFNGDGKSDIVLQNSNGASPCGI